MPSEKTFAVLGKIWAGLFVAGLVIGLITYGMALANARRLQSQATPV